MSFSVVVPLHNEAENAVAFIEKFISELQSEQLDDFEIILVENGSTDSTYEECLRLKQSHQSVRVVQLPQGNYGAAVKQGLLTAANSFVLVLECDFLLVSFVKEALHELTENQADVVVGSKLHKDSQDRRPFLRRMATVIFNKMLHWRTGYPGTDTHGLKGFRKDVAVDLCNKTILSGEAWQTEIVLLAWKMGLTIREVPVQIQELRDPSVRVIKRVPKVKRIFRDLNQSLSRFS